VQPGYYACAESCVLPWYYRGKSPASPAAAYAKRYPENTASTSRQARYFKIYAPKADEVTVSGDFMSGNKPLSLTKNEQGVWSVTVGPLKPDYYTYTLMVDGVRTADPKNPIIKQGISSLENVFLVPGPETAFEDVTAVPHGEVREVWYSSSSLGTMRRMHVYTPPGYEKGATKYPVFYLLHGGGDDDSGLEHGRARRFHYDNLLAAGKVKPMIVVMPKGVCHHRPQRNGRLRQHRR
jgi:enterochelin esterase family protein